MKLSEAIMTGRVLMDHIGPGNLDSCALGMALKACSVELDYQQVYRIWPWTINRVALPCCHKVLNLTGVTTIAHMFDSHVYGDKTWTLEQLCDWVRSVEPAEDAEPVRVLAEAETVTAG